MLAGLSDATDPALAAGKMRSGENIRLRKHGRLGKRYGSALLDTSTFAGGGSAYINAISEWNGRRMLTVDYVPWISQPEGWVTGRKVSRVLPLPTQVVQTGEDPLVCPDVCQLGNGNYLVTWNEPNSGTFYYQVRSPEGTISRSKQYAVGTMVRCLTSPSGTGFILARNTAAGAIVSWLEVSSNLVETNHGTLVTLHNAASVFDAFSPGATRWFLVYQNDATHLTVKTLDVGGAVIASNTITTGAVVTEVSITVLNSGAGAVCVAYVAAGALSVATFSDYTLVTPHGPTLVDNAFTVDGQPGMVGVNATDCLIVWNATDSTGAGTTPRSRAIRYQTITGSTAAVIGSFSTTWHARLTSVPFLVDSRAHCWIATDVDVALTTWQAQRTYWMLDLSGLNSNPLPQMHLAPLRASVNYTSGTHRLPKAIYDSTAAQWVCPLMKVLRTRTAFLGDEMAEVDLVRWQDGNANRLRHPRIANGSLQFEGGYLAEYSGAAVENGFAYAPSMLLAAVGAGGSVDTGTHSYLVVYEWEDLQGRRWRSAPSEPTSVTTTAGNNTVTLSITTLSWGKSIQDGNATIGPVRAHVYRTKLGETVYRRITTVNTAPKVTPSTTASVVTFVDTMADNAIPSPTEFVYTDLGLLPNRPAPACRVTAEGGGRFWVGGLCDGRRVMCSKLIVTPEPVQFVDHDAFAVDFPDIVTAIAWGDGALIAWTATGIYIVTGDGPTDQGAGTFAQPRRIPAAEGCAQSASLLEVPQGWIYQGKRGFYLLPRGFGPPMPLDDVEDTVAAYPTTRSAAVIVSSSQGERTARWVLSNGTNSRVLVWDLDLGQWVSVDRYGDVADGGIQTVGSWSSAAVFAVSDVGTIANAVWVETPATWTDPNQTWIPSRWRTADIRPFGLLGWGQFNSVHLMGDVSGKTKLTTGLRIDGLTTATPSAPYSLTTIRREYLEVGQSVKKGNAFEIDLTDAIVVGEAASEGFVPLGLALDVTGEEGGKRLGSGAKL